MSIRQKSCSIVQFYDFNDNNIVCILYDCEKIDIEMCAYECEGPCCMSFCLGGWFIIFGIGFTIFACAIMKTNSDLSDDRLSDEKNLTLGIVCISFSTISLIVGSCMCHCARKYLCFEKYPRVSNSTTSTNGNRTNVNPVRQPRTVNHTSTQQNSGSESHSIPPPYPGKNELRKEDPPPSYSEAISMPRLPSQT